MSSPSVALRQQPNGKCRDEHISVLFGSATVCRLMVFSTVKPEQVNLTQMKFNRMAAHQIICRLNFSICYKIKILSDLPARHAMCMQSEGRDQNNIRSKVVM